MVHGVINLMSHPGALAELQRVIDQMQEEKKPTAGPVATAIAGA